MASQHLVSEDLMLKGVMTGNDQDRERLTWFSLTLPTHIFRCLPVDVAMCARRKYQGSARHLLHG